MRGFTIVEILISLSVFSILVGTAIPAYLSVRDKNDLELAAQNIVLALRRSQALARTGSADSDWGARVANNKIIVFRGSRFAVRHAVSDEIFDIPSSVAVSGMNEVVFFKFSGLPVYAGSIELTGKHDNIQITINKKGSIYY